jgi:tRNA (mo5U34)-methyltransferase
MNPPAWLTGHPAWPRLEHLARARIDRHGDTPRWQAALASLPDIAVSARLYRDRVTLHPWRKGPFELFGLHIDTEWRSDWKWRRIAAALGDLAGQQILDVGCGNGYFGWRMLDAGAAEVVGVDPSVLFYFQHQAVRRYLWDDRTCPNKVLPLTFEEFPELPFDLVLSMGVVYHRSDPQAHVRQLFQTTRPGGRVLLESLVVSTGDSLFPASASSGGGRYARMRNVSIVPSLSRMTRWLANAGFVDIERVDITPTTTGEQRSTDWMTFESLDQALDPSDPQRTVEGYPAPVRAAMIASKPC